VAVSGEAIVVAHTVNVHRWPVPHREPPYVVAVVALAEDPAVQLTTNIVGAEPAEVRAGMRVRAVFEEHEDVWLPVFEPVPGADASPVPGEHPRVRVRPLAASSRFEHRVAITGVGASVRGRRLGRDAVGLTLEAARAAILDAGLDAGEIDGLAVYPGSSGMPGVSDGGVREVEQALALHPTWHCGAHETPGQTGIVIEAMLAVAAGLCRHALCVSTVTTEQLPSTSTERGRLRGELQWRVPYGAASPANWIALCANRYLERYGVSREALGWIAITARGHAARNPAALFSEPLSMEDYLSARVITTPFGLYDCDVPCDGSIAVVVSARETAKDLRQPAVLVDAVGTQIAEPQSWDQGPLTHQANVFGPAAHLWSRAGVERAEVDVALLYDGFTFNAVTWLEALGFCGIGEAADFVAGGERIALGGALPLNPHGGQLSAGRSNGFGNLHEAVLQLRGQAGERQVGGARVAVVSSGGGIPAGCMLLTAE
jgi:acetyl-CoA acetyltransferase